MVKFLLSFSTKRYKKEQDALNFATIKRNSHPQRGWESLKLGK